LRPIETWQKVVHEQNKRNGFYAYEDDIRALRSDRVTLHLETPEREILERVLRDYEQLNVERKLLLIIGEICEAHEELRAGRKDVWFAEGSQKPEGFPIELADAQIRLWDVQTHQGHDGDYMAQTKHDYNLTRPYKHGKLF
jgi:hypothetical protein